MKTTEKPYYIFYNNNANWPTVLSCLNIVKFFFFSIMFHRYPHSLSPVLQCFRFCVSLYVYGRPVSTILPFLPIYIYIEARNCIFKYNSLIVAYMFIIILQYFQFSTCLIVDLAIFMTNVIRSPYMYLL